MIKNKILYILLWAFGAALAASAQNNEAGELTDCDAGSHDGNMPNDTIAAVADSSACPWPQAVVEGLAALVQSDLTKTSQLGLMVYDLDADSAIFCYNERQTLRPASTMKVITAVAALDKLGGGYQFKTDLCYTGEVKGRMLCGDIYCVGGFDPGFNNDDLNAFVESIRRMGIDTIMGGIYADKTMKDSATLGEGWCWDDDNPCLSPLLVGRKNNFVERLARKLTDDGVAIIDKDSADRAYRFLSGSFNCDRRKPQGAFSVISRFHTIEQVLMKMLKESDNLYAESMFYQIAASSGSRPATAKHARSVINRLITKLGLNPERYQVADGSGLSLYNYVSAELEVRMLRYAFRNENIFPHLYHALPVAGVDGTLKSRMRGTAAYGNVRAKTGTLTGISSLAGYCTASNGHRLCFAIINQGIMHNHNGKNFQDKVCALLCR